MVVRRALCLCVDAFVYLCVSGLQHIRIILTDEHPPAFFTLRAPNSMRFMQFTAARIGVVVMCLINSQLSTFKFADNVKTMRIVQYRVVRRRSVGRIILVAARIRKSVARTRQFCGGPKVRCAR